MNPSIEFKPHVSAGVVVHFVGRLTNSVFSFLGPATETLARSGTPQVLVVIDDKAARDVIPRLHWSVEVLFARDDRNVLRRWSHLHWLLRGVIKREPLAAVHMHGFGPRLIGALLSRRRGGFRAPVYFSPHGSRSLSGPLRFIGLPLLKLTRPFLKAPSQVPIANVAADARRLGRLTGEAIEVVESPVSDVFFKAERHESRRPLLLSSGNASAAASVEPFTRLAVVLSNSALELSFNWIGDVGDAARQRLDAANVGLFGPIEEEDDHACRLAAAWIYVALEGERGFPMDLAKAMASGLPVVAMDTPVHRDLIDNEKNGFLCADSDELLQRVAQLVDSAPLRQAIGQAARTEANRRFSTHAFSRNLLAAYERGEFQFSEPMRLEISKQG